MKEIKKYAEQVAAKVKNDLFDYNKIKQNIYIRLYGKDVDIEFPMEFPHTTVSDLIAVCYVDLSNTETDDSMTTNVSKTMLKAWGVSFETVLKDAQENMLKEFDYHSMFDIMQEMIDDMLSAGMTTMDEFAEMRYNPMRVLTKKDKLYGAGMLAVPEVLEKVFGSKRMLILPSSVHEVITLPYGYISPEEAKEMVQTVNTEQVAPDERLSDSVYIYTNGKLKKF